MADEVLLDLQDGVAARLAGRQPTAGQLKFARDFPRIPPDIKSLGEGRNRQFHREFALGNYDWILEACRTEGKYGHCGRELGAQTGFYYGALVAMKAFVYHWLIVQGRLDDAEGVRRSILSHLAWDALAAASAPLTLDTSIQAGVQIDSRVVSREPRYTPAVAGNRQTDVERGVKTGRLAENNHAVILTNAIDDPLPAGSPGKFGITRRERDLLMRVIEQADREAAREVAGWMFGALDLPDEGEKWGVKWAFTIRRVETPPGCYSTIMVFEGPWPASTKPPAGVCIVTHDGHRTIVKASPRGQKRDFVTGWRCFTEGGVITVECTAGRSQVADLVGREVYRVDVNGGEVSFS